MPPQLVHIGVIASSRRRISGSGTGDIPGGDEAIEPVGPDRDMFYVYTRDSFTGDTFYKFFGPDVSKIKFESLVVPDPSLSPPLNAENESIYTEFITAHRNGVWLGRALSSRSRTVKIFTHFDLDGNVTAEIQVNTYGADFYSASVAKNGNLAVLPNSTLRIFNTSGDLLDLQNFEETTSYYINGLIDSPVKTLNGPLLYSTFLMTAGAPSGGTVVLELSSRGEILQTVHLPGLYLDTNKLSRYGPGNIISLSESALDYSTGLSIINMASGDVRTIPIKDTSSSNTHPNVSQLSAGYLSYVSSEDNRTIIGKLQRNTSIVPVVLDNNDNNSVTDWTVYDKSIILWIDQNGDAYEYNINDQTSTLIAESASINGLNAYSAQGLGNIAIAAKTPGGQREATIYDNTGTVSITDIENIPSNVTFGLNNSTKSSIVPGIGATLNTVSLSFSISSYNPTFSYASGVIIKD